MSIKTGHHIIAPSQYSELDKDGAAFKLRRPIPHTLGQSSLVVLRLASVVPHLDGNVFRDARNPPTYIHRTLDSKQVQHPEIGPIIAGATAGKTMDLDVEGVEQARKLGNGLIRAPTIRGLVTGRDADERG